MKQKNMLALLTLIACFQIHSNSLNADEGSSVIASHTSSHDKWSDDGSNQMSSAHKN